MRAVLGALLITETGSARWDHYANRVVCWSQKTPSSTLCSARPPKNFEQSDAEPLEDGTPHQQLVAHAHRFAGACPAFDVDPGPALFQHLIPGFNPSQESYAPAVRALDSARRLLERAGVRDAQHLDLWTALTTGLVDQQISNDPGEDRWIRLIEGAVAMFLAHCVNDQTNG